MICRKIIITMNRNIMTVTEKTDFNTSSLPNVCSFQLSSNSGHFLKSWEKDKLQWPGKNICSHFCFWTVFQFDPVDREVITNHMRLHVDMFCSETANVVLCQFNRCLSVDKIPIFGWSMQLFQKKTFFQSRQLLVFSMLEKSTPLLRLIRRLMPIFRASN